MLEQAITAQKEGGLSALWLHIIAMALMLCDHMWATVIRGNMWMTCVGRIAFPIFAFLIAEGFYYTRSRKKYLLRLLGLALLSEIPFNLMMGGSVIYPFHQNVIWTFCLGMLCIWGIEAVRRKGKLWLTIPAAAGIILAGGFAGTLLMVDYHAAGVFTVIVFYLFRGRKWWQLSGQLAGLIYINCELLAGLMLPVSLFGWQTQFPQQGFALLALIFIWLYRGRQGLHNRVTRLVCYLFYPAHMLILALIVRWG